MSSETFMVAASFRLQEWADQIKECQSSPAGGAFGSADGKQSLCAGYPLPFLRAASSLKLNTGHTVSTALNMECKLLMYHGRIRAAVLQRSFMAVCLDETVGNLNGIMEYDEAFGL